MISLLLTLRSLIINDWEYTALSFIRLRQALEGVLIRSAVVYHSSSLACLGAAPLGEESGPLGPDSYSV